MIPLKNKSNVTAPNSSYPYGNIKDDTGIGDGTPVDKQVYADFHQFLEKMFANSGLTANGTPDNETNGWQLFEALLKNITLQNRALNVQKRLFSLRAYFIDAGSIEHPLRVTNFFFPGSNVAAATHWANFFVWFDATGTGITVANFSEKIIPVITVLNNSNTNAAICVQMSPATDGGATTPSYPGTIGVQFSIYDANEVLTEAQWEDLGLSIDLLATV